MKLEWNENKNKQNIQKHGFDFYDSLEMFQNPLIVQLDSREDYGEERWQGIGTIQGIVVVIIFTEREPDNIRVISLRKAEKYERIKYEQAIKDGLESH